MVAVRDIHLKDNFTLEEWVSSLTLSDSDKISCEPSTSTV